MSIPVTKRIIQRQADRAHVRREVVRQPPPPPPTCRTQVSEPKPVTAPQPDKPQLAAPAAAPRPSSGPTRRSAARQAAAAEEVGGAQGDAEGPPRRWTPASTRASPSTATPRRVTTRGSRAAWPAASPVAGSAASGWRHRAARGRRSAGADDQQPKPDYPQEAKAGGQEGTVVLKIDRPGRRHGRQGDVDARRGAVPERRHRGREAVEVRAGQATRDSRSPCTASSDPFRLTG